MTFRLRSWHELPAFMRNEDVRTYYDLLNSRVCALFFKRFMDIVLAIFLILLLLPAMIGLALMIKLDSPGPVFFRQERVTQYGRVFRIFKFRTMVQDADKFGSSVTVEGDKRITRLGAKIRKLRLDEVPQLFNVLTGDMTFVGTRPECCKYVDHYSPQMMATLLLPAGITSEASIHFKDEGELLGSGENIDAIYINEVLPAKMEYNLKALSKYNVFYDIRVMLLTVLHVLGLRE